MLPGERAHVYTRAESLAAERLLLRDPPALELLREVHPECQEDNEDSKQCPGNHITGIVIVVYDTTGRNPRSKDRG